MAKQTICEHLSSLTELRFPKEHICEECVKTGASWVHLRTCQTCGATLCCDSSPNKHASKHALASNHPVIMSAEAGERWLWCFVDEQAASY
ncbi:UBP-type zinc finger domain-containing protein [Spirosoma koreense]